MKRPLLLGIGAVVSLAFLATTAAYTHATSTHSPAGNNGFVKINNEVAPDTIPQNHPHVTCQFDVEFYNYDKNNTNANVTFELQAPTNKADNTLKVMSGNLHPFIGQDGAGGGNDLDARVHYTLAFTGAAHPTQGYHVKLTIDAPGSKGSDKKHKVFWVQPCADTSTTTEPTETTTASTSHSETAAETALPVELPHTGTDSVATFLLSGFTAGLAYLFAAWRTRK